MVCVTNKDATVRVDGNDVLYRRTEQARQEGARTGIKFSSLACLLSKADLRGGKFIRWLRQAIRDRLAEAVAVPRLRQLYAQL